jgi:hypothetical protein
MKRFTPSLGELPIADPQIAADHRICALSCVIFPARVSDSRPGFFFHN